MMKKLFLVAFLLLSTSALADVCDYTRNQNLIRSATSIDDVAYLTEEDINAVNKCGGTLLQLGITRGNLEVFHGLLENGGHVGMPVDVSEFNIKGAPNRIPFVLFAAAKSPNSMIIDTLVNMGVDMQVTDSNGKNIFYYFEQNPVLRNSYLTKSGFDNFIPAIERVKLMKAEMLQ